MFGRNLRTPISRANEQEPLCINNHMEEDGSTRIAFSTLADRPSAEDFENSPVLQDWVTATDIRIVFPAATLVKRVGKKEVTINLSDVEDDKKVPRLDLIRSARLISDNKNLDKPKKKILKTSTSFFDQPELFEGDSEGSGDGSTFDDEDVDEAEFEDTTPGEILE